MPKNILARLLGLTTIIVAMVIVFSAFFTGEGYKERHLQSMIPNAPAIPEVTNITPENKPLPDTSGLAPPKRAVLIPIPPKPVQQSIDSITTENDIKTNFHTEQPALDQQGVPVAWILQLATFKDENNAKGLRKKLIAGGYKVFIRKQENLLRVYVGPELQRERLESLKLELKQSYGLDGIIVRFTAK